MCIFNMNNIFLRKKKNEHALESLKEIENLPDNWNDNETSAFSATIINKCKEYIMGLGREPFVTPTATGSIQFRYELDNGDYLEFNISENEVSVLLFYVGIGEAKFQMKENKYNIIDEMNLLIDKFYDNTLILWYF